MLSCLESQYVSSFAKAARKPSSEFENKIRSSAQSKEPFGKLSFIKTGSVVSCLNSSGKSCKYGLNRVGLGLSPCLTLMFIGNVSDILFPSLIQALSFLYLLCRTLRK